MATVGITETTQLTFKLAEEIFAVDVAKVREILDYTPATKVPGTPEFMRGVINVRGNVVPHSGYAIEIRTLGNRKKCRYLYYGYGN